MKRPSSLPEAAVLLIVSGESGREKLLLTKRALHLREHAGEVALPGGKAEKSDPNLYHTALRECFEEVGVEGSALTFHAELPEQFTRTGSKVSPFVASIDREPTLTLCEDEIASAFWVPVSLFVEDQRVKTHVFRLGEVEYWAPVYEFQGHEIWGFTARVLVSFVNQCYGKSLSRAHSIAPEVIYR